MRTAAMRYARPSTAAATVSTCSVGASWQRGLGSAGRQGAICQLAVEQSRNVSFFASVLDPKQRAGSEASPA